MSNFRRRVQNSKRNHRHQFILSQDIKGTADDVQFRFGNADRVMTQLANDTDVKFAQPARFGQITRARLSQIVRLTDLAPAIQEELLFLPKTLAGPDRITEKALRQVAHWWDWDMQKRRFEELWVGAHTYPSAPAGTRHRRKQQSLPGAGAENG